jgi:ABC-type Fe3+ transport system permease subunit
LTINTKQKFGRSSWRYFSYGIAGLVLAPVITVFSSWLLPIQTSHWKHLADHLLASLIWQTAGLLIGVCTLTFIVGVSLAWLCSQFKFPGCAILKRGLILPFAIPAYVNAFVYGGRNIFINTGLITLFNDPDVLKGVIAHELGHITGGHIARREEQIKRLFPQFVFTNLLGVAAMLGGSGEGG